MSKSLRFLLATIFVIGGLSVVSFSQGVTRHKPTGINQRQDKQVDRIKDGVKDGDISRKEFGNLLKEQNQIRRQERTFRSDGNFTPIERLKIQRQLTQSSSHIRRAKHN